LKKSKTKLVPFLQGNPRVFQIIENVGNFACRGHDVVELVDYSVLDTGDPHHLTEDMSSSKHLERKLAERTLYELQKRRVKLLKRQCDRDKEGSSSYAEEKWQTDKERGGRKTSDRDSDPCCIPGAQLQWLAHKVKTELHHYIRSLPMRPSGVLPFSHQWFTKAMVLYLAFLEDKMNTWVETDTYFLQVEEEEEKVVDDAEKVKLIGFYRIHLKSSNISNMGPTTKDISSESAEKIAARIKFILENYGPAVGGMDMGRLMSDRTLRLLTNGEDVRTLIRQNPHVFKGFRIFHGSQRTQKSVLCNDKHSWYVEFDTTRLERSVTVDNDRKYVEKHLLAADEIGSFSLTNRRVAAAMAKLLLRACIYGPQGFTKNNDCKRVLDTMNGIRRSDKEIADEKGAICIDLTAGIGGNVIAFGKLFSRVYAFEIDPVRADLLQRNIDSFMGMQDKEKIIVQCRDSIQGIAELASELCATESTPDLARISIFIDPPFGGLHYRSANMSDGATLCLGENMPLTRVIAMVSSLFTPVTIGLKLPLNFDVRSLVEQLNTESSKSFKRNVLNVVLIKKIERQMFAILQSDLP
jgi:N6-adenine-specific methylase